MKGRTKDKGACTGSTLIVSRPPLPDILFSLLNTSSPVFLELFAFPLLINILLENEEKILLLMEFVLFKTMLLTMTPLLFVLLLLVGPPTKLEKLFKIFVVFKGEVEQPYLLSTIFFIFSLSSSDKPINLVPYFCSLAKKLKN
jgi:hypothetical protein